VTRGAPSLPTRAEPSGARYLSVDILQHVRDVVFHGALGMAATRLAPLDSLLPLGLGGYPALEIRLQLEG
jgi:hypothetical protein